MVICLRRKGKSTCGRAAHDDAGNGAGDLTGVVASSTVAVAVVTTVCAGASCLWPTALLLLAAGTAVVAALAAGGAAGAVSLAGSHAKWFSSKGRLVFHTA